MSMESAADAEAGLAGLRAAIESASDAILGLDMGGEVTMWNPSARSLLGVDEQTLTGAMLREFFTDQADVWDACWERVAAGVAVRQVELMLRRPDGSRLPVLLNAAPVRLGAGPVASVSVVLRDIEEQRLAQETLAHNAQRLAESEALAHVGSWAWDGRSDEVQWSQEMHRIHGLEPQEFDGTLEAHLACVHPEDQAGLHRALQRALVQGSELDRRFRVIRPDGTIRWVYARAEPEGIAASEGWSGLRGIYHDITDSHERAQALQSSNDRLRQLALYDDLTGLASRGLFLERLQHALNSRNPEPLVVCFLDLDDFKAVNDVLSHATGDVLLRIIGERLAGCLRPIDTAARFGGDEFAVLLERTGLEEAAEVAGRILDAVSQPLVLEGMDLVIHVSVGLAPSRDDPTNAERLLAEADAAVYTAKARGGHRVEVFEPEMRVAIERRARLRSEIEHALAQEELCLNYQPIVDIRTGQRHGVEALVRWRHPQRGMLLPRDFIEDAEASGQIRGIDRWVLAAACRTAKRLPLEMLMSVNTSARQLLEPGLVDFVADILHSTGVAPKRLVLEITETAALSDIHATISRLKDLRSLGLAIALDDFGTGYSPLSHLRQFPADYLKVDQSFVRGLVDNAEDRAIVRGVIDMAHAFGLLTVAEGIESASQRDILEEFGCDFGQGHYWASAMTQDQLLAAPMPEPRRAAPVGAHAGGRAVGG